MNQSSKRLKKVRLDLDLTQSQLGHMSEGMDASAISNMERGTAQIRWPVVVALYNMGVNIHWLLSGDGKMMRGDRHLEDPQAKYNGLQQALQECQQLNAEQAAHIDSLSKYVDDLRYFMRADEKKSPGHQ